jgi:hypothetical protein
LQSDRLIFSSRRAEIARRQDDAEHPAGAAGATPGMAPRLSPAPVVGVWHERNENTGHPSTAGPHTRCRPRRITGSDEVNRAHLWPDGVEREVTLEIEAEMPSGAPDHVERMATWNNNSLKFGSHWRRSTRTRQPATPRLRQCGPLSPPGSL